MARGELRWRDLIPGVIAALLLAAFVVGVLLLAQVGALRGDSYRLTVFAGSVRDVVPGSEVWLAGKMIGLVEEVRFRAPSTDTAFRLALRLEILDEVRPLLRTDSRAQIRSGGSLLGAPVVALTVGTSSGTILGDGDTVRAVAPLQSQTFASGLAMAGPQIRPLRENIALIVANFSAADGTLSPAFRTEQFARAGRLGTRIGGVRRAVVSGRGSAVALLGSDAFRARVLRVAEQADSVRELLASGRGTMGRFQRDSSLTVHIADVQNELSIIRALLARPEGTAGRIVHDGVLVQQLEALEAELRALTQDVRQRPFRYLVF